ncbi:MAG: peptidoglycan DD-metalloendopeptidase family protein [Sphingomicrobium sp.]
MRFALIPLLIAGPLIVAASAPVQSDAPTADIALARARAEANAADAQVRKLQAAADSALSAAGRLHAQQLAAAEAIQAAEARINASDAELRLVTARHALLRARLQREQQPLSALLAGLAMMARRPPLLALADRRSTDELVEVRVLLDATLPVIRARTEGLSRRLSDGAKLEQAAVAARAKLQTSRRELGQRRAEFAALEQRALESAAANKTQAVGAGDAALAAGETVESLSGAAAQSRSTSALVAALAVSPVPPPAPIRAEPNQPPVLHYALPVDAPVIAGVGSVSASGVRSRGLTMASYRGAPARVPASGIIRFAGPFRDYDGVVIIDHGGGWISLLVNIGTQAKKGDRVQFGAPLGRALGPVEVELSLNGQYLSPALIAGSSVRLSKSAKRS